MWGTCVSAPGPTWWPSIFLYIGHVGMHAIDGVATILQLGPQEFCLVDLLQEKLAFSRLCPWVVGRLQGNSARGRNGRYRFLQRRWQRCALRSGLPGESWQQWWANCLPSRFWMRLRGPETRVLHLDAEVLQTCGLPLETPSVDGLRGTIDHILHFSLGGAHYYNNCPPRSDGGKAPGHPL